MTKYLPTLFGRDDVFTLVEAELNDVLNNFFQPKSSEIASTRAYPKMDIFKQETDLIIEACVPFTKKESLTVTIEPSKASTGYHLFTLSGSTSHKQKHSDLAPSYLIRELRKSDFTRRILLESKLVEKCPDPTAEMKDGILTITFKDVYKKDPADLPKEIKIG